MIVGYIRVSTDRQAAENQRFEILKFADEKKWAIDEWVEESISGLKKLTRGNFTHFFKKCMPMIFLW